MLNCVKLTRLLSSRPSTCTCSEGSVACTTQLFTIRSMSPVKSSMHLTVSGL